MQLPYRKPGKYTNLPIDHIMTQSKYDDMVKDLALLKKKKPHAMSEVSRLAEMGDFSENVEYQIAKGRLRGINAGILKLDFAINHAEIISPTQSHIIQVGSTVTVFFDKKEKNYTILGSSETDPANGIISYTSPLAVSLLGAKVGDNIIFKRGQKDITIHIVSVN